MSKKNTILFSAITILLLTQPRTVTAQTDRIDSCIAAQMLSRHIPGLVLAVIRDGVPVKVKGYGLANIELNVPVNTQTIFQSGSIAKQFTAMLVMLLVEQGKINLDEPISSYFRNSPAAWQKITVRHLLTHTAGIADYTEGPFGIDLRKDYTEDQLLEMAQQLPLDFQPGEKWAYSDTGYMLLGILIHKVSGRFYGDLLKQYIFQPLSMETVRVTSEADIIPNRAAGYRLEKGEWKNQEWAVRITSADGTLCFTILDLIKWDAALSSGRILSKTSFDQTWLPVRLNGDSLYPYGFGWFLSPINGHKAVWHEGEWPGFNAYICRYLDDRLTVIVLTNLNHANPLMIARHIAGIYIPDLAVKTPAAISDRDPQFTAIMEKLYRNPDTTNVDFAFFTKDFQPNIGIMLKFMLGLLDDYGPILSFKMVGYNSEMDGTKIKYRIRYKVGSRIATITRNKSGQVSNIYGELE